MYDMKPEHIIELCNRIRKDEHTIEYIDKDTHDSILEHVLNKDLEHRIAEAMDTMYAYRFESPERIIEMFLRITGESEVDNETYQLIKQYTRCL